jgi:hypothetical protein
VVLEVLEVPVRSLTLVPGIGARIAERLVAYFGNEDSAIQAIAWCRIGLLEEAVGRAAAVRLVHGVYRLTYGRWPRDVAASEEAWQLFLAARRVMEHRALTRPGRDVISCYLPAPTPDSGFETRQRLLQLYADALKAVPGLDEALQLVADGLDWPKPVKPPKLKRLLIVIGDRSAYEKARTELAHLVDVEFVEDVSDVEAAASDRDDVVIYDPYGVYQGPYTRVADITVEEVAPEAVVEQFKANWRILEALKTIIDRLGVEGVSALASVYGATIDPKDLNRLTWLASVLRGGDIAEEVDSEYSRLRRAFTKLEAVIDDAETWANEVLREELERLEVRMPASRLLEVLTSIQRGEVPSIELPEELYEVFTRVAEEVERKIAAELDLEADEAELLHGIAPRTPSYPLTLDRRSASELKTLLAVKLSARRLELLRMIAEKAKGLKKLVDLLVQLIALIDAGRTYYQLASRKLASYPLIVSDSIGLGFRGGLEAELMERLLRGDKSIQKVSYVVGKVPVENPTRSEHVVLLTGANSGGKTTLLKTLAEVALLAQAALPVYAEEAWVSPFDHVFFLSKPQGEVGAGALEQMVKTLARIATLGGRRLILIDELEAATEAGAAARMIAGFIEYLATQRDVVAVIVTHLAGEVLRLLPEELKASSVRVDGIEAKGLDENYNLIVDRNPKYYRLASSTPQLVVMKLVHTTRRKGEKEFYEKLLSLLSSQPL